MNGNQKESFGLQDQPITGELGEDGKFKDDILGLGQYAEALSVFIQQCATPITIAVSGPWGSGKTSIMNMIRNKLGDKIIPVWFNCWQFSQFDLSANLSAVMMNFIRAELYKGIKETTAMDAATETVSSIWNSTKGFLGVTAKVAASVTGIKADQAVDALIKSVDSVQSARDNMEKMVNRRLQNKEKDRVVIFIDDLDRVTPSVALELLEVMKLFLDVKGCVFVMACDFDVVKKGVAAKFKSTESEIKGRSFFDKLIQLSFNIPVSAYETREFVRHLLEQIGYLAATEYLDDYLGLLKYSIGFNPRSLKILANSLTLVNNMRLQQDIIKMDLDEQAKTEKIIFALNCMERAYPELHQLFITKLRSNDKPLHFLVNQLSLVEEIIKTEGLEAIFSESPDKELTALKIKEFVHCFVYDCLDTDGDKSISKKEIEDLKNILKLSSLTARQANEFEVEDTRNDMTTNFCKLVYEELRHLIESSKYPKGHDRDAGWYEDGEGGEFRAFQVWFKPSKTKKNWGKGKIYYEIMIEPQDKDSLTIFLLVNYRDGSVVKDQTSHLFDLPICQDGDYEGVEEDGVTMFSRELGPVEITTSNGDIHSENAKKIAQDLRELIEATHNLFDV